MPIYGYKCLSCGHKFETLYTSFSQAAEEEPKDKCPACGANNKVRADNYKGQSHALKGGGWAKDNYGLKKPRK